MSKTTYKGMELSYDGTDVLVDGKKSKDFSACFVKNSEGEEDTFIGWCKEKEDIFISLTGIELKTTKKDDIKF